MATKKFEKSQLFKPAPPPHLSKETLIIWESWSNKGDREVAREAAAKGSHTELALTFLSQRKGLGAEEISRWFKDEILSWVLELLMNKQIFRATHIINNINLDPNAEIVNIFEGTQDTNLRNFLGNHLLSKELLNEDLKQSWELLKSIEKDESILAEIGKEGDVNLKMIHTNDLEWKQDISAKLFLKNKDQTLSHFLNSKSLWKTALKFSETSLLCNWINIQYSNDLEPVSETDCILKTLEIDTDMLNLALHGDDISQTTRETMCDTLATFGIFKNDERTDAIKLIGRLFRTRNLHRFETVLKPDDLIAFRKGVYDYCLRKELYTVLEICTRKYEPESSNREIALIKSMRELVRNFEREDVVIENVQTVLEYLGVRNEPENGIILLFTLMRGDVCKLLSDHPHADFIFENLPVFSFVYKKYMRNLPRHQLSVYDLLEKHSSIDVRSVYKHRFDESAEFLHFDSEELVEMYGSKKKVDYTFYLMQSRPSKAAEMITGDINRVQKKVFKIAARNFTCTSIAASCIVFMEKIGLDSDCLRVELFAARKILSAENMTAEDVADLFLQGGHEIILSKFENAVCIKNGDTMAAFKALKLPVKYANYYNLKLPTQQLIEFAREDQWLGFLIAAQHYNYPQDVVVKLTQHFSDENLVEHLHHCMLYDIQLEQNALMRDRDSRKYYLSRVGVRKSESDAMVTSVASGSSLGSTSSGGFSDFIEGDLCDVKTDLLQILIKCHNSNDPPRALLQACCYYNFPLMAILATSYEPDSLITNWLTWLAVSCRIERVVNYDGVSIEASKVTDFLVTVLKNGFYKTLRLSFDIFLPENPLQNFVFFLQTCIDLNFDPEFNKTRLDKFHKQLRYKRSNSFITEMDHDLIYMNNKLWIENTALGLLSAALQYNIEHYNRIRFLELLNAVNIADYFLIELPNFKNLLDIMELLFVNRVSWDFDYVKLCDINEHMGEIYRLIDKLIDDNLFEIAISVSKIASVSTDKILLKKWRIKERDVNFWDACDKEFRLFHVNPESAFNWFLECDTDNDYDHYQALKLAYNWGYTYKISGLNFIERKMWTTYLRLDCLTDIPIITAKKLFSQMEVELKGIPPAEIALGKDEETRFDALIEKLLQKGCIYQALRLEKLFERKNTNLDILKLCFNLAEGLKSPFQMTAQERLLLRKGATHRTLSHRRKTFLSARLSSYSAASRSPAGSSVGTILSEVESSVQDNLSLIENLVENLGYGVEAGERVLMTYRISINIGKAYQAILENSDPVQLLLEALAGDCENKLEVANDFVLVYKWSKQEIADFLCEQIINAVMECTRFNKEVYRLWDINLDTDIHLILQLLPDSCSILGMKLYNYATAIHESQTSINENPNLTEIIHVVELLIRAHDCYTVDCNMEGISIILKKCQTLINLLLTLKHWPLIVRLLTGIGRYNELNYVLHILRENDQFEYLLRKGKSKVRDNGLKVALLGYLKKFCPENRELYRMVALHFTLYSEVAQLWEDESRSIIRNLIAISKLEMQNRKINPDACLFVELTNTDGTRLCLTKAMENYTHAAEYHLQGEKLASAMNAAQQAELMALQLSLLKVLNSNGTATCILNLNHTQISSIIVSHLSFHQTLILTEAYNYQADWGVVLFEQYILQNSANYLDNFLSVYDLTDQLVYDISRRFLSSNINDEVSLGNMRHMLQILSSVHMKYRIASELGFLDIIEDLLNGNSLVYLKDTVWKKGYRNN